MEIETALQKALHATKAQVEKLVQSHGGKADEAARAVLTWTREDHPTFIRKDLVEKALYKHQLHAWAMDHDALKFLDDASLLELDVTLHHNPTYPTLAFRVPLKATAALAKDVLHLTLSDDQLCYAIAIQALQQRKVMKRAELETLLRAQGLRYMDVSTISPVPREVLESHILADVDIASMAPGQAMQHAPKRGIEVFRERREMTNRIFHVKEKDTFQLDEGAEEFVDMILAMNVPVI